MHLDELHVTFYDQYDEAYKANFYVYALNKTYQSTPTRPKISKVNHSTNRSHIDWNYKLESNAHGVNVPKEVRNKVYKVGSFEELS